MYSYSKACACTCCVVTIPARHPALHLPSVGSANNPEQGTVTTTLTF